ncbi:MAG: heterodisulfide reductase-related iron-sulfur binding cluster [Acidobacteriota bacterium]
MGRYRGTYDEPRSLLGTVVEPPRNRERSFCCGAGGGLAFLGEETGERVSHNRAKELVETGGADYRGRVPPSARRCCVDGLAAISTTPPKLLDVAEITAASLPAKPI